MLSVSSTSLFIAIYLIKSDVYLFHSDMYNLFQIEQCVDFIKKTTLLGYLIVPIILLFLVLILTKFLSKDEFKSGEVVELESIDDTFLPSYLGYFFVALSIADGDYYTMFVVFAILTIFLFLSQKYYFNPIFILFKYKFYRLKTKNGLTVALITKRNFRKIGDIQIDCVYRINDFTFIER